MREIKFRGKRIDNGEWIKGLILRNKLGTYIITEVNPHECTQYGYLEINEYGRVNPETVGQLVQGESYTGDIFKVVCDCDSEYGCSHNSEIWELVWHQQYCQYGFKRGDRFVLLDEFGEENIYLVGNIYDSPELIEVTA